MVFDDDNMMMMMIMMMLMMMIMLMLRVPPPGMNPSMRTQIHRPTGVYRRVNPNTRTPHTHTRTHMHKPTGVWTLERADVCSSVFGMKTRFVSANPSACFETKLVLSLQTLQHASRPYIRLYKLPPYSRHPQTSALAAM